MRMQKIIICFIVIFYSFNCLASKGQSVSYKGYNKQQVDINKLLCYQVYDPYEKFNRAVFTINDTLDHTILIPISRMYNKAVPSWGRVRIRSFFTNLASPLTFINNLLQGNGDAAVKTFFRFMINSTFGLFGTLDFAKDFGLYQNPQTFGNTFASYGANYGAYLVLPILGPSTVRHTAGIPFDAVLNPLNLVFDGKEMWAIYGGERFTARAANLEDTNSLQDSSLDYYAKIRSMYIQYIAKHNPKCKKMVQIDYSIYQED